VYHVPLISSYQQFIFCHCDVHISCFGEQIFHSCLTDFINFPSWIGYNNFIVGLLCRCSCVYYFFLLSSFLFIHAVLLYSCCSFICNFPILKPVLKTTQRLPAFSSFSFEQTFSFSVLIFWYILPLCVKAFSKLEPHHDLYTSLFLFWKHKRQQKINLQQKTILKTTVL